MRFRKKKSVNREKRTSSVVVLEWLYSQYRLAELAGASPWKHALELPLLRQRGIKEELLRVLLDEGLIEHRIETTKEGAKPRRFRRCQGPPRQERSCFVLSEAGVEQALTILREEVEKAQRQRARKRRKALVPRYDAEARELWYGKRQLARFPVYGSYTTCILQAFEAAKWTQEEIDNPLPGYDESVRASRLRGAVRNLNRDVQAIRFQVSRGGRKLRWLRVPARKE
jgi:hypothetical protein